MTALPGPSFARNFERELGQSPIQYLTDWRLTLARDHLLAGELTLEQIAAASATAQPTRSPRHFADTLD